MPTSMWNKQTFSIATDDFSTLTHDEYTTVMGALVIDLVSAPIAPGTYNIHLTAMMGGIQIFLPAYAKVHLDGKPFWGGKRIEPADQFWREMRSAFANSNVQLPATPPTWASASYEERPVTLNFTINTIMSGAGVYQLESNSVENKYANQPDS